MTDTYEGGCHCGKLRYTCNKKPDCTFYCHCHDCQKTTGGPFSVELMIDKQAFEIDGSKTSYTVIGESGGEVHRWACRDCGSGVYLECDSDPEYIFLKAGSLDDASWVTPEMHIFTSAKQPWVNIDDGLPQHETQPEV